MKILQIEEEDHLNLGELNAACESWVQRFKSIFSNPKPGEERLKAVKESSSFFTLVRELDKDLKVTYDDPAWLKKNLPDETRLVKMPAMTIANVNGKQITKVEELLEYVAQMHQTVKAIAQHEKPFVTLRQQLVQEIRKKNTSEAADEAWLEHQKELGVTSAERMFSRYRSGVAAIGCGDGPWPVKSPGDAKTKGFNVYSSNCAKTDGTFEAPSRDNAEAFVRALRWLLELIQTHAEIFKTVYVPYYDIFDRVEADAGDPDNDNADSNVKYSEMKYPKQVSYFITRKLPMREVSDLSNDVSSVFQKLAIGLYIAMFDKHQS